MKFSFILFAAAVLLFSSGCGDGAEVGLQLDATIGNESFSAEMPVAELRSTSDAVEVVSISGIVPETDNSSRYRLQINISFPSEVMLETRNYAHQGNACSLFGGNAEPACLYGEVIISNNGSISVFNTEHSDQDVTIEVDVTRSDVRAGGNIAGSFSFNAQSGSGAPILVTDGVFDLPIEE